MPVRVLPMRRLLGVAVAAALFSSIVAPAAMSGAAAGAATPKSGSPSSASTSSHATSGKGKTASTARATFGIAPATPGHVDDRTQFGYRLAPTASYDDHFVLTNYSAQKLPLTVTTVDLFNDPNGDVDAGLSREQAKDAGKWIILDHDTNVVVPSERNGKPGQVVVAFTVKAPKTATPGDHAAGIIASLTANSHLPNATNLRLNQRIGVRVLIRVPGDIKPGIAIRNLRASYDQSWNPISFGRAKVSYTIVNTGNVIIGANQSAAISGMFGAHANVPPADTPQVPLLLPGGSAKVSFVVDGVPPAFSDKVKVTLTPLVQKSDAPTIHVAAVGASTVFTAIPWIYIVILIVVILLLAGVWWWRRRRKRRRANTPPSDGPKARTLQPA